MKNLTLELAQRIAHILKYIRNYEYMKRFVPKDPSRAVNRRRKHYERKQPVHAFHRWQKTVESLSRGIKVKKLKREGKDLERFTSLNEYREDICHWKLEKSEEPRLTMKVRELIARLEIADQDDLVIVDATSHNLFLLSQKSGKYRPLLVLEDGATLTDRDKEFLCSLRIRF